MCLRMKETISNKLIVEALNAATHATGIIYKEHTSFELRRVMLELAENGACDSEYEGDGYFTIGLVDTIHISEMSDIFIAKNMIKNYS